MKTIQNIYKGSILLLVLVLMTGCGDSFLNQDPQSFYEPKATYSTEAGLKSALSTCDKQLKNIILDGNGNVIPMASNYIMSDVGLYAKTDMGGGFQDNFDGKLTPTSGMGSGGDGNAMKRFWYEGFTGVKYANTVLSYVDKAAGLDNATRDAYKGRAYFHRAYMYYHLVLQFGDIPLITKIIDKPKQDYHSTSKEAIFQMLVHDLEFAVEHVPSQREMTTIGMVNKEACMHLLTKCYLVTGQYKKAEEMATKLINNQGLHLMISTFGTFVAGNQKTWPVTDNVMWDLFRGENVCDAANKELIMPILNFNPQNFTNYPLMRACFVHWSNGIIRDPSGLSPAGRNLARNASGYNENNDWVRAIGRGIGCFRTSKHYNQTIWNVDGSPDDQDMRHNRTLGNWVEMEDIKYSNPKSPFYGQRFQLYATADYVDAHGKTIVKKGDLLCGDTIRSWYPTPLYKCYIFDKSAEDKLGANQFNGATTGSNGNMYLFRLAETYLLRAEACFYQGDKAGAAADVNVVRKRANARHLFTAAELTIGTIADERARELYMEEWRQAELVRISWCLAKSGQPDEWGNTYDIKTWDKQEGTDKHGGSYWFRRLTTYSLFNNGPIQSNGVSLNYQVNKRNLFWPVPNSAITANNKAKLRQNYGYDGYDATIPMWDDWQKAVASE